MAMWSCVFPLMAGVFRVFELHTHHARVLVRTDLRSSGPQLLALSLQWVVVSGFLYVSKFDCLNEHRAVCVGVETLLPCAGLGGRRSVR